MFEDSWFLILVCGSIGRRHINNIINLGFKNIILYDINKSRSDFVVENYNGNFIICETLEEAIIYRDKYILDNPK